MVLVQASITGCELVPRSGKKSRVFKEIDLICDLQTDCKLNSFQFPECGRPQVLPMPGRSFVSDSCATYLFGAALSPPKNACLVELPAGVNYRTVPEI